MFQHSDLVHRYDLKPEAELHSRYKAIGRGLVLSHLDRRNKANRSLPGLSLNLAFALSTMWSGRMSRHRSTLSWKSHRHDRDMELATTVLCL